MEATRGWQEGERGVIMDVELQFEFGMVKKFWRQMVVMVAQYCDYN